MVPKGSGFGLYYSGSVLGYKNNNYRIGIVVQVMVNSTQSLSHNPNTNPPK